MFGTFPAPFVEGLRKGKSSPAFAVAKGGDTMNEPNRTQWQIRCAFNGFCKRTLKNEAKLTLTIKEAAEYSNIGINKIDTLLKQPNCPFVLFVGTRKLVKRREFEEYIRRELII